MEHQFSRDHSVGVVIQPVRDVAAYGSVRRHGEGVNIAGIVDADKHRMGWHAKSRARDFGFSVAEIGELLGLWTDRSRQSADVKRLAQAHIVELEQRIESLREIAHNLQEPVSCCAGDERLDCTILAEFEHPEEGETKPQRKPGPMSAFRDKVSAQK